MLEHEADIALADAVRQRILAVELHLAFVRPLEARDDAQQRRLARTGRTEQRDQFAGADIELDLVERGEIAEALGDVEDRDPHRLFLRGALFEHRLRDQRHQREQRQQRGDRERGRGLIAVVERSRPAAAWCWSRREYGRTPPRPRRTRPSRARCTAARRRAAPISRSAASRGRRSAGPRRRATARPPPPRCPAPASAGSVRARRTGTSRRSSRARCREPRR